MPDFVNNLTALLSSKLDANQYSLNSVDWLLLSNGLTEFDENIIFFGFDKTSSTPSFVAKVPRLPKNIAVIQTEYERLLEICKIFGENAKFLIPQPIALSQIHNQPVLITTYVNGASLVRLRITKDLPIFRSFSLKAAKTLRYVLDATMTKLLPGETVQSNFLQKAEKFKKMYPLQPTEIEAVDNLCDEITQTERNAAYRVLIHGDYWHGNIILEPKFGNYMLVDWQYSRWTHDASQDVYLFLLAGALATIPNSVAPQIRAQKAVRALLAWKDIVQAYLSEFGRPDNYNIFPLRSGMLLCCIEKAVRASLELGFDREEDLVWFYFFRELLSLFDAKKLSI